MRINIFNDFSFLETDDDKVKHFIKAKLRFRDKGYFHNRAYKAKKWDGYIDFFDLETGKFLTGLLPEVKACLQYNNCNFTISDNRTQIDFLQQSIDDNFLEQFNKSSKPVILRDYQTDLVNKVIKHKRGILFAPTSAGKAQPLYSEVYTPTGIKTMGEIKLGDQVITPDGNSANVIGVFPQGEKKILRIHFSNGDYVDCCEDHLWKVNALYDQWNGKILTAREIKKRFKCNNGANRFNISTPKKLDFNSQTVTIDPYIMGLLLGDGSFRSNIITFTNKDKQIVNTIRKYVEKLKYRLAVRVGDNITYGVSGKKKHKNYFTASIADYGLKNHYSYEKFVPDNFKINDFKTRLSVLQGLMDTDGTVCKNGKISFVSASKQLAKDVKWLVQSLGGVAYTKEIFKKYTYKKIKKTGRKAYLVSFTLPAGVIPFRLKRKIIRCKKIRIKNKNMTICNVEYIGKKPCQCILIDHKDHLYITNNCIITHNTLLMAAILKNLPPVPTLVLQNRVSLADQNYKELLRWDIERLGCLWGKKVAPDLITVASVQSISKIAKALPKIKVLIVDEIHDMMSKLPKQVYRKLKDCGIRIALSATPFKFGGTDDVQKYSVKGFFGPVLKTSTTESGVLTTKYLQDRDILSKSNCRFIEINEPQLAYHTYQDAITHGLAENDYFHEVVTKLARNQTGRTLILVDRIAHGDALHARMPTALWVRGQDNSDSRNYVIDQLKNHPGNVIAIATQQIFNTGISVYAHNLINAASGQAEHQIIQRMGRGLRTADDKVDLNYYDFLFNINKYLLSHSKKRIKILTKEGHEIKVIKADEI